MVCLTMPLMSPIQPAKRQKSSGKSSLPEGTIFDHDSNDYKKSHHSKESQLHQKMVKNGLCPLARRLAGGKVPNYKQDATVKLWVHFKNCTKCCVPDRPDLRSTTSKIANKLKAVGLFTPAENGAPNS